jgi:hypothetical protein
MVTTVPDPQLAAARHIAKSSESPLLVRLAEHGAVEVVSVRRGRVNRDRLDLGGTAVRLESQEIPRYSLIGIAIAVVGLAMVTAPFWAGLVLSVRRGYLLLIPFFAGALVMSLGYSIEARPAKRLRGEYRPEDGWAESQALSRLSKKPINFVNVAQLRRIEELGDYAALRPAEDGGVDVVIPIYAGIRRASMEHWSVDRAGRAALVETTAPPRLRLGRLKGLCSEARALHGGNWAIFDIRQGE